MGKVIEGCERVVFDNLRCAETGKPVEITLPFGESKRDWERKTAFIRYSARQSAQRVLAYCRKSRKVNLTLVKKED